MPLPENMQLKWREMDDNARAIAYSPSSALDGPIDPFIQAYAENSAAAYAALLKTQEIAYGTRPSQTLDIVVPDGPGPHPLIIFMHGGYWCQLSKRDSFGSALDAISRGIGYAAIDYTLAPDAKLGEIVQECTTAVTHIIDRAAQLAIDPARILLAGSSAGAHLAAMACLSLPQTHRPASAVLLSGVYDLSPLIGTYINDPLDMDLAEARDNSPILKDLAGFPPSVIAWGAQETDEFKRQSLQFAHSLQQVGTVADTFEVAGRNHFDIIEDLIDGSALGRKTASLIT